MSLTQETKIAVVAIGLVCLYLFTQGKKDENPISAIFRCLIGFSHPDPLLQSA